MANKFNFGKVKQNFAKLKSELPLILANEAKNSFLDNFRQQGFDGARWQEVQRRTPDTDAYKYPKKKDLGRRTRAILQGKGSGRLRKDVANSVQSGYPIKDGYVGVVHNEYATYHNEGTDHLPKRQFVGFTPALLRKLRDKVDLYMGKIWK